MSPKVNLTLPCPRLNHVPQCHVYTSFRYLQGWCLNRTLEQPVPVPDSPFTEEIFPNIQSKPPMAQPEAISSCPISCYLGEETNTHLATTSFQVLHSPSYWVRALRTASLIRVQLNNRSGWTLPWIHKRTFTVAFNGSKKWAGMQYHSLFRCASPANVHHNHVSASNEQHLSTARVKPCQVLMVNSCVLWHHLKVVPPSIEDCPKNKQGTGREGSAITFTWQNRNWGLGTLINLLVIIQKACDRELVSENFSLAP